MTRRLAIRAALRAEDRADSFTAGLIYDLLNGTATEADAAARGLPTDVLEDVLETHRFNQQLESSL
jgi:hypothetical protein